jgi:hypothetical protein
MVPTELKRLAEPFLLGLMLLLLCLVLFGFTVLGLYQLVPIGLEGWPNLFWDVVLYLGLKRVVGHIDFYGTCTLGPWIKDKNKNLHLGRKQINT